MTENYGPSPEQPQEFRLNVVGEIRFTPEQNAALDWYREKINALPEVKTSKAPVTNGEQWKHKMTENGEVDEIEGAHFKIEGRDVVVKAGGKDPFGWSQPIIVQRSETARTKEGEEVNISGIVLLAKDPKGRVLVVVSNEPGADSEIVEGKEVKPQVRTPIQTSVQKLKELEEGDEKKDPVLFSILSGLAGPNKSIRDVIREIPLKKIAIDANRMESNVFYGVLNVDLVEAKRLEDKTGGRFLTKGQLNVLPLNGHTHIALSNAFVN